MRGSGNNEDEAPAGETEEKGSKTHDTQSPSPLKSAKPSYPELGDELPLGLDCRKTKPGEEERETPPAPEDPQNPEAPPDREGPQIHGDPPIPEGIQGPEDVEGERQGRKEEVQDRGRRAQVGRPWAAARA